MSGESALSELLGRSFASGSSFLSSQQYGKDADVEGGRLMRMDSGVRLKACSQTLVSKPFLTICFLQVGQMAVGRYLGWSAAGHTRWSA